MEKKFGRPSVGFTSWFQGDSASRQCLGDKASLFPKGQGKLGMPGHLDNALKQEFIFTYGTLEPLSCV